MSDPPRQSTRPVFIDSLASSCAQDRASVAKRVAVLTRAIPSRASSGTEGTREFGRQRVYQLRNLAVGEASPRVALAGDLHAPALFGDEMTHARLAERLDQGWQIKSTKLSEAFGWARFIAQYGPELVLLFCIEENGTLRVVSSKREFAPLR